MRGLTIHPTAGKLCQEQNQYLGSSLHHKRHPETETEPRGCVAFVLYCRTAADKSEISIFVELERLLIETLRCEPHSLKSAPSAFLSEPNIETQPP